MTGQKKVKIGVTGHLSLQNPHLLGESIRKIMNNISNRHPDEQMCFYSPLSPGADLLSAKIAVECSIQLFVIVPFNQEKYLLTFSAEDRKLFLQLIKKAEGIIQLSEEKHDHVYQMLGDYLVENMDYLIAIWNGQEARGPGGTGEVVQSFKQSRKPLVWIRANNMALDQPVLLPDSLLQGSIQYENW
jgi:hypothetical protein